MSPPAEDTAEQAPPVRRPPPVTTDEFMPPLLTYATTTTMRPWFVRNLILNHPTQDFQQFGLSSRRAFEVMVRLINEGPMLRQVGVMIGLISPEERPEEEAPRVEELVLDQPPEETEPPPDESLMEVDSTVNPEPESPSEEARGGGRELCSGPGRGVRAGRE